MHILTKKSLSQNPFIEVKPSLLLKMLRKLIFLIKPDELTHKKSLLSKDFDYVKKHLLEQKNRL